MYDIAVGAQAQVDEVRRATNELSDAVTDLADETKKRWGHGIWPAVVFPKPPVPISVPPQSVPPPAATFDGFGGGFGEPSYGGFGDGVASGKTSSDTLTSNLMFADPAVSPRNTQRRLAYETGHIFTSDGRPIRSEEEFLRYAEERFFTQH
jgi:hypothetical protein